MKPCYEQDGITIYHGDCREILPTLPKVDLVLTDPPYGIDHSSNHGASWQGTKINGDSDTVLRDWVLSRGGWVGAAVFGSPKIEPPECTRGVLIWDKGPAFGMGDISFPWKCSFEEIYVLGDGWRGKRDEGVLKGHLVVSWESKGRKHPHEKPVSLLRYLAHKHGGELILDPFMGSGTTLLAAKLEGKQAIGIEIEEKYCEIAKRRLRQKVLF